MIQPQIDRRDFYLWMVLSYIFLLLTLALFIAGSFVLWLSIINLASYGFSFFCYMLSSVQLFLFIISRKNLKKVRK